MLLHGLNLLGSLVVVVVPAEAVHAAAAVLDVFVGTNLVAESVVPAVVAFVEFFPTLDTAGKVPVVDLVSVDVIAAFLDAFVDIVLEVVDTHVAAGPVAVVAAAVVVVAVVFGVAPASVLLLLLMLLLMTTKEKKKKKEKKRKKKEEKKKKKKKKMMMMMMMMTLMKMMKRKKRTK